MTVTKRFEGSWVRLLAVFATAAMLLALVPTLAGTARADHAHDQNDTERLRMETQQDRFGTAIDIANRAYPEGTDTIVLARAEIFADALAGSLVAGALDAPILLTTGSSLHPATAAAIDDLLEGQEDTQVVLLGGVAAISANTESQVDARDSVDEVVRIEGKNRFDTARNIAHFVAEHGLPEAAPADNVGTTQREGDATPQRTAIVATGQSFADALASGPLAAGGTFPLLLTARDFLSGETEDALTDLDIDFVWIAGGVAAVSAETEAEIEALGIETERVRVEGGDRSHTAVEFAKLTREVLYTEGAEEDDDRDRNLAVATGLDANGGVDALALAPLAAKFEADLVISRGVTFLDGNAVDGVTQPSTYIQERCHVYGATETPILIAGGVAAISASNEAQIKEAALCTDFAAALTVDPPEATNVIDEDPEATNEHTVTVAGTNPSDEPAAGAVIQVEVYTETDQVTYEAAGTAGTSRYEENGSFFVVDETSTVTLGEDGTAPFSYELDGTDPREDRVIVCGLPGLQDEEGNTGAGDRTCTTEDGELPQDPGYGQAVAAKSWVTADATFNVTLTSAEEVGDNTADASDGITGAARVLTHEESNTVCWRIEMNETSTTDPGSYEDSPGAHIHEAPAGATGDIVVNFDPVDDETLTSSGCVTLDVAEFDVAELASNPASFYVNVHSSEFPGGAARGQLA